LTLNDAHCHFFSSRFLELLTSGNPDLPVDGRAETVAARIGWIAPGTPAQLADRWVEELDRHHVGRAAMIASIPGDEESVAAAVARHPKRFIGFFMVNPQTPEVAARLERGFTEHGLRCACLFPAMHKYKLDDERVRAVFEAAERHHGAVFVHCGVLTVGVRAKLGMRSPFDLRLGDPLAAAALAGAFPTVPVLIPHFGAGFFREALMAAGQCRNIHFDTSSSNSWMQYYPGLSLMAVFRQALDVVGPERLLFGTDSSFFPRGWQKGVYDAQVAALDAAGCSEPDRELVFGGNFDRIFRMQ
jgi:uncharacterized protein